jgi:hypothetical protein
MEMTRRSFLGALAGFFAAMRLPRWLTRKPKPTYLFGKDAFFVNNLNAGQPFKLVMYQPQPHDPGVSYSVTYAFGPPPDQTQRIRHGQ